MLFVSQLKSAASYSRYGNNLLKIVLAIFFGHFKLGNPNISSHDTVLTNTTLHIDSGLCVM